MSVYLCVSVSLGLCRGIVSFSEMQMVTLNRPEPPCRSGCSVMMSVTGLCVCLCALGKEEQRFGVLRPFPAQRLFWRSPSDSRGGGCQSAWDDSKGSQVSTAWSPGDLPWSPEPRIRISSRAPPARPFLPQRGYTVHVGTLLPLLCMCTCTRSYPTIIPPCSFRCACTGRAPHGQTQLPSYSQITAKALPARYLFGLVK